MAWCGLAVLAGLWAMVLMAGEDGGDRAAQGVRLGAVVLIGFAAMAAAGSVARPADQEVSDAIDAERVGARRQALREIVELAPAIVLGAAAAVAVVRSEWVATAWSGLLHWTPLERWQPVYGLSTAAAGAVIGGSVGWVVRWAFTLWLGKEAYGAGDIHMMAAAGAVAGWSAAVMGFFLAAPFALLGVVVFWLRGRGGVIQFGPWLTLGVFLAMLMRDPVYRWFALGVEGLSLYGPHPGWLIGGAVGVLVATGALVTAARRVADRGKTPSQR